MWLNFLLYRDNKDDNKALNKAWVGKHKKGKNNIKTTALERTILILMGVYTAGWYNPNHNHSILPV